MKYFPRISIFFILLGMFSASLTAETAHEKEVREFMERTGGMPSDPSNHHPLISEKERKKVEALLRENWKKEMRDRLKAFAEPKNIALIAKTSRSLFKALIAEGFTEQQALEITARIGLPGWSWM
jgi:hypothetical protein